MTTDGNNVQGIGDQTSPPFTRPHFFQGQLLTADDLRTEQEYVTGKRKWHNRLLHGYGVVCGLEVRRDSNEQVIVEPGYAIDALGNDIVVASPTRVVIGPTGSEHQGPDEWRIAPPSRAIRRAYLAVKYAERLSDPVPVPGGGPEEENVEFARIVEGFEIGLMPEAPEEYHPRLSHRPLPGSPCLEPTAQPWVALAIIYLGDNATVLRVVNDAMLRHGYSRWEMVCRRLWSLVTRNRR